MKTLIMILALSLPLFTKAQDAEAPLELKPFVSDYCSKWPEGGNEDPTQWADCCFTHDLHYWLGGTDNLRSDADKELRSCVKLAGASFESFLMYIGVRIGGKPGDADFAWGYGWSQNRGYDRLPIEDIEKAKVLLENFEYNQKEETKLLITKFIEDELNVKLDQ